MEEMQKATVNNELTVSFPEGFTVLTREELQQMYLDSNPDRWGIRSAPAHQTAVIMWKKYARPEFLLPDAERIAHTNEGMMREGLKDYGYVLKGFFDAEVCGMTGCGYDYEYTNQGTATHVRTVLFRHHSIVYSASFYWRASEEAPQEMIREMLASMEF